MKNTARISKNWRRMAEIYRKFVPIDVRESDESLTLKYNIWSSQMISNGLSVDSLIGLEDYLTLPSHNVAEYDFSEEAAMQMFSFESTGQPRLTIMDRIDGKYNGYAVGKHWMDATIKSWRECLDSSLLAIEELKCDYPDWFLKKVLPDYIQ